MPMSRGVPSWLSLVLGLCLAPALHAQAAARADQAAPGQAPAGLPAASGGSAETGARAVVPLRASPAPAAVKALTAAPAGTAPAETTASGTSPARTAPAGCVLDSGVKPAPGELSPGGTEPATIGLPEGFLDETQSVPFDQAVGFVFGEPGHMYVWEKQGRVWLLHEGVKESTPFLDISEEVGDWFDYGFLSFALDPDFASNGFVYAFYVVDYHYLTKFGTAQYDPQANEYNKDTIARITRFTANPLNDFHSVLPGSRKVLLGESITTGIPITGTTHGAGSLVFGSDGTLMASCGDGNTGITSLTALSDGIIKPKEDVGSYRSQLVDSLSGKLLRLDPSTGDGLPGNPFYDPSAPRAPRSRVWALGLRQPCRFTRRPDTGSTQPGDASPGTFYVGDVGAETWEELDVVRSAGRNFGWPMWEGLAPYALLANTLLNNLDAPNPLFGIGGCTQPFFHFQDLFEQDTLNVPQWTNPCNASVPITTEPLFTHTRPVIAWQHGGEAFAPSY
ncbi:MAG TPA: PQQ-dependent sugar dehydrogenase, partial [Planctomycetota bacterium]|nr:PQQ-dependent sugar dehydrogenase [Planctomycetota bacterium]